MADQNNKQQAAIGELVGITGSKSGVFEIRPDQLPEGFPYPTIVKPVAKTNRPQRFITDWLMFYALTTAFGIIRNDIDRDKLIGLLIMAFIIVAVWRAIQWAYYRWKPKQQRGAMIYQVRTKDVL